ncbi:MAG: glycoside hydrolase family 13 protein [Nocardiopsaceae bacterium]|nr:glycoside hydrolase family 13 protein [Nocardiopsaceae bacterium]
MNAQTHPWWSEAIVYQVYPRSFADGNGDGIGDLRGLIEKLPYLEDLGVDAVWLTPFYPSPLADGGYDVADYCDVDPRIGTLQEFDQLLQITKNHNIRVIIDLVPNHCSASHPLFQAALAAKPGSAERGLFIFRDGRGPGGDQPPNNWPSNFGGPAWTRVGDGQWYLHLFDSGQPDWDWRNPEVRQMFEKIIRFWLDRGVAGLRVDVAHGMFKEPGLPDLAVPERSNRPNAYTHRPEIHELYRTWRAILDSYDPDAFPGARTAVGEVWADSPPTLQPYLAPGGLPQVFNFELITSDWKAASIKAAVDATLALAGGSRAPWVLGNHDVLRPVTRLGGPARARAAALLLLALPGSAYVYQGEELGLPEVLDLPDAARQDPRFFRTKGKARGRDGCRIPLPWSPAGPSYGFSRTDNGASPAPPWLPQPEGWGAYSAEAERPDPDSFYNLYRAALRLRRSHPALGLGRPRGTGTVRWLDAPPDALVFGRDPGFVFAANLGDDPLPLPPHEEVLLASSPLVSSDGAPDGALPPDGAAWLAAAPAPVPPTVCQMRTRAG